MAQIVLIDLSHQNISSFDLDIFINVASKEKKANMLDQRFPTWGARTPRGARKISSGPPDFHKFKINTKIFTENAIICQKMLTSQH